MKPEYCTQQSVETCAECSLTNYRKDCMNNPIAEEDQEELFKAIEEETLDKDLRYVMGRIGEITDLYCEWLDNNCDNWREDETRTDQYSEERALYIYLSKYADCGPDCPSTFEDMITDLKELTIDINAELIDQVRLKPSYIAVLRVFDKLTELITDVSE